MTPITPKKAFARLLKYFGPRGWWPVTLPGQSLPTYRPGSWNRLSERQRLEVCVGAILTQNTAWSGVTTALGALQGRNMLSLRSLCSVRKSRLESLIRSSGYFRQKSLKLKAFVKEAVRRGSLRSWLSGPLSKVRTELLSVFGVGNETADSILLYAGARRIFVIDAYTLRIGSRVGWFGAGTKYEEAQSLLTAALPGNARLYGEFHALIVELAKRFCRTKPDCAPCPLRPGCRFGMSLA